MEEITEQPIEIVQKSNNIIIILLTVLITTLIVGSVMYGWQKLNQKTVEHSAQKQISVLQDQIQQLQQTQATQKSPAEDQVLEQSDQKDIEDKQMVKQPTTENKTPIDVVKQKVNQTDCIDLTISPDKYGCHPAMNCDGDQVCREGLCYSLCQ